MERKHWIKHVEAWKESGLTRKMYCQENDVKASTFNTWVRCYRDTLQENASDLVEIKPKRSREVKPSWKKELAFCRHTEGCSCKCGLL